MNHRSSLLLAFGILCLIAVVINRKLLNTIVSTNSDFSEGDVMGELSYTNRSILQKEEQKKGGSSSSSSSSSSRWGEGTGITTTAVDIRNEKTKDNVNPKVDDDDDDKPSSTSTSTRTSSETITTKATTDIPNKNSGGGDELVTTTSTSTSTSSIAGLNCDRYGGPDEEVAAEMVYWRDIPSDSHFVSPYDNNNNNYNNNDGESSPKYLTFEPDEAGWNNIRMSIETATALAHTMGRILVLPFEQNVYLLGKDGKKKNNLFTFKDFFPFDAISEEHKAVEVITMEEFLDREVMSGKTHKNGKVEFPPFNRTNWDGDGHIKTNEDKKEFWYWLRNVTVASTWKFNKCTAVFPKVPGKEASDEMEKLYETMDMSEQTRQISKQYINKPTPVDGPVTDRLREMLSFRKNICLYNHTMQQSKVIHYMGDNKSKARLLVHFYAFLFFEDWEQDLWTKRYVRDHMRYIDEIQCAAAKIVQAVRQKAIENNGDSDGIYDSMHVRTGDFQYQYKQICIPATEIYENIHDIFVENSTIFIATDKTNKTFFEPLQKHYNVLFLNDFLHLVPDLNKNYYGMLDQRIASRGRTFAGAYLSTFTGYINRMRGYHSQKEKLPGHEMGILKSYFYAPKKNKDIMTKYASLKGPMFAREFPVAWRDIDHNLEDSHFLS